MLTSTDRNWDWEIKNQASWWGSGLPELWSYRYLLVGLVRRDFLLGYQQTVLGPLWLLLQPIMTMITYVLVFGKVVGISTGESPPVLFYMAGIILWNLFNDAFTGTSSIFRDNAHIFSKVYFPRLIVPFAQLSGFLISFGIQFLFLLLLIAYYLLFTAWQPHPLGWMLLVPFVMVVVSIQSLALGLLFSVLTGKYRDVKFVVGLGVRLLMFLTPVIYPMQYVTEKWRWVVQLNPLTSLFELFRWALLGQGLVSTGPLLYSISFTLVLLLVSLLTFNKQGSKLIDVI
ncbi:ABC-2 type transporter [Hymenobacter roseosalivarius DSM 11622]|uniref:Transport permease protein n=1 Tax=Hymenobacter roseosalivarius DSM 11622 TaxID=645990 RepID=A0A1W1W4G3_9BACT|nr:ABC transporter permease [Hymenobacter roseosalivarius]SMC00403.1 ABC-2 type transporter [Hymenobacter roseosalivarius DSM 11622]